MIEAKIIEDSISEEGIRLTTMELKMPRIILSEANTHRQWSRNSSSSRAIPAKKLIKEIIDNPFMPVYWGKNKPGMSATEELSGLNLFLVKLVWKIASLSAVLFTTILNKLGLHKQIANRVLEPFMYTKTIVTSTEWDNFFKLRIHSDSQPEICELATKMKAAMDNSTPKLLKAGEWHLPYISTEDKDTYSSVENLIKMSVARCARVSYLNHDGKNPLLQNDLDLYNRLVGGEIKHSSPSEHQATPMPEDHVLKGVFVVPGITHVDKNYERWSGNIKGWIQYRQLL